MWLKILQEHETPSLPLRVWFATAMITFAALDAVFITARVPEIDIYTYF